MNQYNQSFVSNTLVTYDLIDDFPDEDNLPQSGQQHIEYYDNILGNQIQSNMSGTISPQSRSDSIFSQTGSPPSSTSSGRRPSMGPISISYALNKQERRRNQNRLSQRAFRERKAKERATLEEQLNHLADKHQRLQDSYSNQSDEVCRLKQEIQELTKTIDALSSRMDGLNGSTNGMWTDELLQDLCL